MTGKEPENGDRAPSQTTPKGATIPVPKRGDFLRDLAKVAPPPKPRETPEESEREGT